jgi:hypothetical protein
MPASWTDLTFSYLEILSHTKMNQLDANFDALAEGASGAPKIQTAAITDANVTFAKLSSDVAEKLLAYIIVFS